MAAADTCNADNIISSGNATNTGPRRNSQPLAGKPELIGFPRRHATSRPFVVEVYRLKHRRVGERAHQHAGPGGGHDASPAR